MKHGALIKAVFPVAGMGTRFFPATKASPKEMLPIVDKPLIQYAVEEAQKAGLTEMILITNADKSTIKNHFDRSEALEKKLLAQGAQDLHDIICSISLPGIRFKYIFQSEARGLGDAILCAKHAIGQEPFVVLLADDLIDDSISPCLSEMIKNYQQTGQACVAVQEVPDKDVSKYGIVDINVFNNNFALINAMIEKPKLHEAFSHYAAIGRYIFTPALFSCLENTLPDHNNELQLTSAISQLIQQQSINAFRFNGKHYDCGSKLGYVKATIEYALRHNEIGKAMREELAGWDFVS